MIRISPKFAQAICTVIRLTAIVAFAFTAGLWCGYHKNPAKVISNELEASMQKSRKAYIEAFHQRSDL